ncbi:hypothetical protein BdWA1_000028 [Babesia duncani]|uniref:Uncharacterized protein n=1 Tax=Babesia duncani TaxID=323732 RepID=A0AAD9UPG0_9APIC|nr:hypothetical protein BdWA1_000028 [Babesia duncani]
MFTSFRNTADQSYNGRGNILAGLFGRTASNGVAESIENREFDSSTSGSRSRYASTLGSPATNERSISPKGSKSSSISESYTPLSRSDQLKILLAREYHSAPACTIDFLNASSSFNLDGTNERDSTETLVDGSGRHIALGDLDAFSTAREPHVPSTSRTSLISSPGSKASVDQNIAKSISKNVELNPVVQEAPVTKRARVDTSTSPLQPEVLPTTDYGSKPTSPEVQPQQSTIDVATRVDDEANAQSTRRSNASSSGKLVESERRDLPVYCRSLLYRIRVPLWQRLKRGCELNAGRYEVNSPQVSGSRTNLSCDRVGRSINRSIPRVETMETLAPLHLSDLDTDGEADGGSNSPVHTFTKNPGNFRHCFMSIPSSSKKKSKGIVMDGKLWLPGKLILLGSKSFSKKS